MADVRDAVIQNIIENHEMIDAIRIYKKNENITVEMLKDQLGITRSTADKMYNSISGKEGTDGKPAVVERIGRHTLIKNDVGLFLGISIGSSHIRAVLLGLGFERICRDRIESYSELNGLRSISTYYEKESDGFSYAFRNSDDESNRLDSIRKTVTEIVTLFLRQVDKSLATGDNDFPLMGIGFGVAGPVDYEGKIWRSAPRITSLRDITIQDLIGYENQKDIDRIGLFLSLDNNSKTSIISEYQYLLEETSGVYCEDIALLYIGSGVGSAAVIDKKLLRGSKNHSGELGHVQLFVPDPNSNEAKEKTVEACLVKDTDYTHYLPYVLNTLNCILGIDRFVLVGHNIRTREALIPKLMDQRIKFTVSSTQQYCKAETGRGVASTAAIGAAIEAYFCMCNYRVDSSDRVNLAKEISWK